jgi:SAM-dependent methyltransferase
VEEKMQKRHHDSLMYFQEQVYTVNKYILPFISEIMPINKNTSVFEIGCGEGGNLKPFLDRGCNITGVDLAKNKIENARSYLGSDHSNSSKVQLFAKDIYELPDIGKFDLIFTKDVLEHIHDQERFMNIVKKFLKPGGKFFLGFPPWYNPFGGHQQVCSNKLLSVLPYFHLLPLPVFKRLLRMGGESDIKIKNLLEIRFERILKLTNYKVDKRTFYLINPNYEIKFKLKPRNQSKIISSIPYLRDFFTTATYYIVSPNQPKA